MLKLLVLFRVRHVGVHADFLLDSLRVVEDLLAVAVVRA